MEQRNIKILRETDVLSLTDGAGDVTISIKNAAGNSALTAQAVLVATGRRPNIERLHLENAGVALTDRNAILVDKTLHTSVPNIWAMGDVTGGMQFTYISLDDSRIIKSQLLEDGSRTTENRNTVPYSIFIDPPLSRVGLTEHDAIEKGYTIRVGRLSAAAIPKAQVIGEPKGFLKVIIDTKTNQILGAHLFCAESHEMINQIKMAMDANLPYTMVRDAIYTHPTMSESFNDLFSTL